MRTVVTIAVDQYDESGNCTGMLLAARASSIYVESEEVVDHLTARLPENWRQVTYEEALHWTETTTARRGVHWEQLSIF